MFNSGDFLRKLSIGVIILWAIVAMLVLQGCEQVVKVNAFEELSDDAYIYISGKEYKVEGNIRKSDSSTESFAFYSKQPSRIPVGNASQIFLSIETKGEAVVKLFSHGYLIKEKVFISSGSFTWNTISTQ